MKTIAIFTSTHGHESIALAIKEKIETQTQGKYRIKLFANPLKFYAMYDLMYKFHPSLFGSPFQLTAELAKLDPKIRKAMEAMFFLNDRDKITRFIKRNKVDLCISTYFTFNPTLSELRSPELPFINIITDPKTVHPMILFKEADAQLSFDQAIEKTFDYKNIVKAGWFVREAFETPYVKRDIRQQLGIDENLTILVTSGSVGANAILKLLPSIINCQRKVNFIMACGKNKFLYHNILGIKKSLATLSSSKATIIPLGFTKELHLYIKAADLVVGKAGPNTLFESVACETPFFATTHIHGQEDGNLDIIRDYKIGIVEENDRRANQKLTQLIKQPQQLEAFKKPIQKLKAYNQRSITILLREIDRLIG